MQEKAFGCLCVYFGWSLCRGTCTSRPHILPYHLWPIRGQNCAHALTTAEPMLPQTVRTNSLSLSLLLSNLQFYCPIPFSPSHPFHSFSPIHMLSFFSIYTLFVTLLNIVKQMNSEYFLCSFRAPCTSFSYI